jgi:hypothetical protein
VARATRRLDLLVLPLEPDAPAEALAGVVAAWSTAGFLGPAVVADPQGPRGAGTDALVRVAFAPGARVPVDGGVGSVVWQREASPRFLANRAGGFRVRCPVSGRSLAERLHVAVEAWRNGAPRVLDCACGALHDLAHLDYVPPAGFARGWIELADVGGADLVEEARILAPDVRLVLRRG